MAAARVKPGRAEQVQTCLSTVMDPELDESVTELGFVTDVVVQDDGEVHIGFRLPTYWCAANFAFLMADDMRLAVQVLPWVTRVRVRLSDHMDAEAINRGVAEGTGFQAAFGAQAEGGLDGLRQVFLLKAFQRRQEALLQHLLDAGHSPAALVALETGALAQLGLDAEGDTLVERYLARRDLVGGAPLAFVETDGRAIAAEALKGHLRGLRRVGVNAEFNSVLCRGLLAVRDNAAEAATATVHPIHIVRRPAPAAAI
jgi:metal-sulfur cluster biosynthetic enzyme